MRDELSHLLQRGESVAAILLAPSVVTYEFAHFIVYRLFGYSATIEWDILSLADEKRHVETDKTPKVHVSIFALVFAPFLLIISSVFILVVTTTIFEPTSPTRFAIGVFGIVQGIGFVAQSGPSDGDIFNVYLNHGRRIPIDLSTAQNINNVINSAMAMYAASCSLT